MTPAFVDACRRATGGNALLVGEVLAELDAPDAGAVVAAGVERVGRRVARRLAALGDAAPPLAARGRAARRRLRAAARCRARRPRARRRAERGRGAGRRRPARGLRNAALQAPADPGGGHGPATGGRARPGPCAGRAAARGAWRSGRGRRRASAGRAAGARPVGSASPARGRPAAPATRARRSSPPPTCAARSTSRRRRTRARSLLELGRAEHAAGASEAGPRLEEAWRATADPEIALEFVATLAEQTRWREAATVARTVLGGRAAKSETDLRLFALLADSVRMDPTIEGDEPDAIQRLAATLTGATQGERYVLAAAAVIKPVDTAEAHAHAAELVQRARTDATASTPGSSRTSIRAGRLDQALGGRRGGADGGAGRRIHPAPRLDAGHARLDLARTRRAGRGARRPRRRARARARCRAAAAGHERERGDARARAGRAGRVRPRRRAARPSTSSRASCPSTR